MDFQIVLYSHYIERYLGIHISGILYNIVGKAQLKQSKGETQAEFEERRVALIAKSKSGKSTAKQQIAEPDDDFQARLAVKYTDDEMFHRELLIISSDQFYVLNAEIWELCLQLLLARRTGRWYQNPDFCFHYNRPCSYFPICRSGENPNVIENLYRVAPPHSELSGPAVEQKPVF